MISTSSKLSNPQYPNLITYCINFSGVFPVHLVFCRYTVSGIIHLLNLKIKIVNLHCQGLTTSRLPKVASIAMKPAEPKEEMLNRSYKDTIEFKMERNAGTRNIT